MNQFPSLMQSPAVSLSQQRVIKASQSSSWSQFMKRDTCERTQAADHHISREIRVMFFPLFSLCCSLFHRSFVLIRVSLLIQLLTENERQNKTGVSLLRSSCSPLVSTVNQVSLRRANNDGRLIREILTPEREKVRGGYKARCVGKREQHEE